MICCTGCCWMKCTTCKTCQQHFISTQTLRNYNTHFRTLILPLIRGRVYTRACVCVRAHTEYNVLQTATLNQLLMFDSHSSWQGPPFSQFLATLQEGTHAHMRRHKHRRTHTHKRTHTHTPCFRCKVETGKNLFIWRSGQLFTHSLLSPLCTSVYYVRLTSLVSSISLSVSLPEEINTRRS